MSDASIETDITVYGATGFVGKHVCRYLLAAAAKTNGNRPIRLTLAGRNLGKLEARRDSLDPAESPLDVFVADSSDLSTLKKMAERTLVVLNCAGPFMIYGTNVVAACAQTGTDYVDITGEITWAGKMRAQYGNIAKASGSRIISLCGFDSIPSEMSILAAVEALREACASDRDEDSFVNTGYTWHAAVGPMNGGTLHSALNFPLDLRYCAFSKESGHERLRKVPFLVDDPMILTHPTNVRHNPDYKEWKDKMAAAEWRNQLPSMDSIVQQGMSLPFFMAPVNAKVVHASAVALKYGKNFTYMERLLPLGFRWTQRLGKISAIPALLMQACLYFCFVIFSLPVIGAKLADWTLPPGSGLPDVYLEPCHAEVYAEVTAEESSSNVPGTVDRATCFIGFQGDPGNLVTAQCVGEAALALVFNRSELPPRSEDGFGTPAELLGLVLLKRLKENTVRSVKVVTKVRRNAPKHETEVFMY